MHPSRPALNHRSTTSRKGDSFHGRESTHPAASPVALLLALAAFDPEKHTAVIGVAIASYTVHGMTHILRSFGWYYGGGAPIPSRPQQFELRDGLQLLAAATGMLLFFP
jgi:hypothetical protein